MAPDAVRQFFPANPFLKVFVFCFDRIVFVTVVAGIPGISGGVAGDTGDFPLLPVIQGEGMLCQAGRLPGLRCVTGCAVGAK